MDETPEGCGGEDGCIRPNDWPDYPTTSVLNCQGQCRYGAKGRGPTHPNWIARYCSVAGSFYNSTNWEELEFNLCKHRLVKDPNGMTVENRPGTWSAVPNKDYVAQWKAYNDAVATTLPFYRQGELQSHDIDSLPANQKKTIKIDGKSVEVVINARWKRPFPAELVSSIVGPAAPNDITTMAQFPQRSPGAMRATGKVYHAQGQPACGLMGNRAYVGSGRIGKLISLDHTKPNDATWRIEAGSEFPWMYKKSNGEECLMKNPDGTYEKFLNMRQNFGTVVTTQGLWMVGGLVGPSADLEGSFMHQKYAVEGCTKHAHLNDVWVFNPKGWTKESILSDDKALIAKYKSKSEADIFPKRIGYPEGTDANSRKVQELDQSFEDFRFSDTKGGKFDLTIDSAIDEGWACTGVQGKWCRKPFIPRPTKGAESLVMCFEPSSGKEEYKFVNPHKPNKRIPRRPRSCMINETDGTKDEKCICYIINMSGQSGRKQEPQGSGFRPEIDYLEIPRADGKYGSDDEFYADFVEEYCPDADDTFPGLDPPIKHHAESAVKDYTDCTEECGGKNQPKCNRKWKKINLRRKWHEAGRIKHARMGFLSGTLKGEMLIWGGECYGPNKMRAFNLDGTLRAARLTEQPRPCGIMINKNGEGTNDDYMEVFSMIRMNKAGYLFGERRHVELDGYRQGKAAHDESAVSQSYSVFNTQSSNFV